MTLQQLRYVLAVAENGSITEAAKRLYISQPSLSSAIRDIEKKIGFPIFIRSRIGISLTRDGTEFLGYARQVLQQMELLEDRYISDLSPKVRFGVSAQHYTFTANAFVELVKQFGNERYEFILNETTTHQIIEDVKNRFSDLGILYISRSNEAVLNRAMEDNKLCFHPLFSAHPHIFVRKKHPLAEKESVSLEELKPFPRLNFIQGNYGSSYYSEELFSTVFSEKEIRISDRGAIVNFMVGLDAYTISSGIFPSFLHGNEIVSIPLEHDEDMTIGYVINDRQELSRLGKIYIELLLKYRPDYR